MNKHFYGSWTVLYDTIYACQDRKDDADVGVKSTALLFGNLVRPILCCFALVFLASLTYMGYCNDKGAAFYVISCGGASAHVTWQLATWDPDDPKDCGAKFKSNGDMGYIIWAGLMEPLTETWSDDFVKGWQDKSATDQPRTTLSPRRKQIGSEGVAKRNEPGPEANGRLGPCDLF
ncbi:hypothetical protein EVG20_g10951 [Dentipellis fragilis]|uniref:Uncharacterized protein n=1 Tax=Dentipellis fragilis TaxID=205917 RepID=A0A4Y9XSQ0_9AGAM|nr:hypothetical protein EVG20_g10951 [Dentipellis fragilis]